MPFKNENIAAQIPEGSQWQEGVSNDDGGDLIEEGVLLPWPKDRESTWVYYEVAIGSMLDSGLVVHNRLPQVDNAADSLAKANLTDPNLDRLTGDGVNLTCRDQYEDIVQRMGHSRYWFRLWGQALRIGYQIQIPKITTIGGVPAIPYDKNPQWAYNRIAPGANYSGVILWQAQWSLWYTTAIPPTRNVEPELLVDVAAHINGTSTPPTDGIQAPWSVPDDNVIASKPPTKDEIIRGG